MDYIVVIELILFVILIGFSGFFSSCETAMFSLNQSDLTQMRRDANPKLKLIERLLSEPRRLIVTILIGNEFVNVAASVISAAIVIKLLGAENKLINVFIMVPILLLFGEITPKTLAIRNNMAFAAYQSGPIDLFAKAITPLRIVIRVIADFFTTLIVGKERTRGSIVTEDMIRTLAREAVGDGVLNQHEARYIEEIFNFGDLTLKDIQTARSNIFFLPADMPPTEMLAALRRTRYKKVPIFHEHRDVIKGVLHARDLLGLDLDGIDEHPERLLNVLRKPYLVPETKTAAELFRSFRIRKQSLALTVDEYGGITGMVSMEDLMECIFGSIPSASDVNDSVDFQVLPNGNRHVESSMSIEQFNQEFGTSLQEGEYKTIGGMILQACGELPAEGTAVTVHGVEFIIDKVENNRIQQVTIKQSGASDKGAEKQGGVAAKKATPSEVTESEPVKAKAPPPDEGASTPDEGADDDEGKRS